MKMDKTNLGLVFGIGMLLCLILFIDIRDSRTNRVLEEICELGYMIEAEGNDIRVEHPLHHSIREEVSTFYNDLGRVPDYVACDYQGKSKSKIRDPDTQKMTGAICEYSCKAFFNESCVKRIQFYSASQEITIIRPNYKSEMDEWRKAVGSMEE